jgi:putative ABC transport system permease protein
MVVEAARQALATLRAHPLRTTLGALAIFVAVFTMVAVTTALDGFTRFAAASAARAFGSETFVLAQVASRGSASRKELERKLERNPPVRRSDLRFLEQHAGGQVIYAPSAQRSGDATAGGRRFENATITGTTANLARIRDLSIESGRFLLADEETRAAQVAVIGADLVETLFPAQDAVGQVIRVAGRGFTVVGVQARQGTAAGVSLDRSVFVPLTAWERAFGAPPSLQVFARPAPGVAALAAEAHVRATMRARRQLGPGVEDTFDILTPDAARTFVFRLSERISLAAIPISVMALLAAVVVVTNTVLVSVSQRTREIGVRRALGARQGRIMSEVVAESTIVAIGGGGLAVLAAWLLSDAVAAVSGLEIALRPGTVVWSLGAAALSGLLAGWYPARRAVRLDVIAALRSE